MKPISQLFSSFKSSFRDVDFMDAEKELKSKEDFLRTNYDALDSERSFLKLQLLQSEELRRKLTCQCDSYNDKVIDLEKELNLCKERESKANRRYNLLCEDIRVMGSEKDEVLERLGLLNDEVVGMRMSLREKENEIGNYKSEVEELRVKIRVSEGNKEKFDGQLGELKKVNEFLEDEKEVLTMKIGVLEGNKEEFDDQLGKLKKENELLEDDKEELTMKIRVLEGDKKESKERIEGDLREKEEKVERVMREIECLKREKREAIKRYERVEQIVLKLEEDVARWVLVNLSNDKKLASIHVGKVLCNVIKALDSEGGVDCKEGTNIAQKLKDGATTRTFMDSDIIEAPSRAEASGNKKVSSSTVIVLSDSDSENENPVHAKGPMKEQVSSQSLVKRSNLDISSDENLNSTQKLKKFKDLLHEHSKHTPSIVASGSRSDNEFVTPQKQVGTALRQCNVTSVDKVKGTRSHGMLDGDNSQYKNKISQADVSCSPQAMKLIATCRKSRHS